MYCMKCERDLSQCTCPDLKERLEGLLNSPHLHFSQEARDAYTQQAEKNEQKTTTE